MIDRKIALKEFQRFSGLEGYHGLEPSAVSDCLNALQDASTEQMAHVVVTDLLMEASEASRRVPSLGTLRRAILAEIERNQLHHPPPLAAVEAAHLLREMREMKGTFERDRDRLADRHLELLALFIQSGGDYRGPGKMPRELYQELIRIQAELEDA